MSLQRTFALLGLTALVCALAVAAVWQFVPLAEPQMLVFGFAPLLYVGADLLWWRWRASVVERLGASVSVEQMAAQVSLPRRAARTIFFALALLLAGLSLARPQWGERAREIKREGIDLVIAIDVSRSMLADDISPSRLGAAKREVDALLRELDGDRVGLVVFSGVGFVQSPLTSDYGAIRLYLDRLDPEKMPVQGTAIGRALEESQKLLTGNGSANFTRAASQLVVVLTDGEDHEGDPVAAARKASADKMHVYTIGFGTDAGARIPLRNPDGSVSGYLSDRQGNVVQTRLVEEQLKAIATAGDGSYVRYAGDQSIAGFLLREIDSFDAAELSSLLRREREEQFGWFVGLALLFALLGLAIGDARRALPALALLSLLTGCSDLLMHQDPVVADALQLRAVKNHEAAAARIEEAGEAAREQAAYDYDRGLVLMDAGKMLEARDALLKALRIAEPEKQVQVLVALGNLLMAEEAYDDAIERFTRALRIDPTNAAARRNLEIALLKKFPRCGALEDKQEENDSPETAKPLSAKFFKGEVKPEEAQPDPAAPAQAPADEAQLVACGGDADWLALPVVPGARVEVTMKFKRLREDTGSSPPPAFIAATAVAIALYGEDTSNPIAVDEGRTSKTDKIAAATVTRTISVEVGATKVALLRVFIAPGLEMSYVPSVEIFPPCSSLEDRFEANNSVETATSADTGSYEARICAGNPDWYGANLQPDDTLFVDLPPASLRSGAGAKGAGTMTITQRGDKGSKPVETAVIGGQAGYSFQVDAGKKGGEVFFEVTDVEGAEGPYQLEVTRFAACPVGNDKNEPNDLPDSATTVDLTKGPLLHQRLCDSDVDWFVVDLPEPEKEGSGEPPPTRPFSAAASWRGAPREVTIRVYNPATGEQLAASAPSDPAAKQPDTGYAGVIAAAEIASTIKQVRVVVDGAQGFYDLSFPDLKPPPPPPSEDDKEKSDQSDKGDKGDPKEPKGDGEEKKDGKPEEKQGAEEQAAKPEGEEEAQAAKPTPEEEKKKKLMQLLNSLDPGDTNLQLQQALEKMPETYIEKEW